MTGPGALLVLALAAQTALATVSGVVRDEETGAPLAGAVVTLRDLERGVPTDAAGRYELRDVPPGPQHLGVQRVGYAARTLHALVPRGGTLEINVALRPEPIRLTPIEVRTPVVVRGTGEGDDLVFPDRRTSMAAVRNHPLLAEPDVLSALSGGEVALAEEIPSGIHIHGGASDQTGYVLDGVPVLNPYHAAGVGSAWNPDAISQLRLTSAATAGPGPHALSGTVEGFTRAPGPRLRVEGAASTTQARLTAGGPLGAGSAGYVVSLRSGLHGLVAPRRETSYLHGGTGDWLGKIETDALGGRLRLLGYGNSNELEATAATDPVTGLSPGRHVFGWHGRSFGAGWTRAFPRATVRVQGWGITGDAAATWFTGGGRTHMGATRSDGGGFVSVTHEDHGVSTAGAFRVEQSHTTYRVDADSVAGPVWDLDARTPVVTLQASHARPVGGRAGLDLSSSLAFSDGGARLGGGVQARWRPADRLVVTARYGRTHQFAQSLRNPESVVRTLFPVDVSVGASTPGVPVAADHQGLVAVSFQPSAGVRFGVQAHARRSDGLLLVAPLEGGPFATRGFATGSATTRGASAEFALSSARYGIVASYGLQRVRIGHGDSTYVPESGITHLFEGGVIAYPTTTLSLRLGIAAALGRRTTPIHGDFEWESCNLLDRGCEFVGTPDHGGEVLGGTPLPDYLRVDVGVRKHWHVRAGGRDTQIGLFGTVTNLLGRRNLLTYSRDLATGHLRGVEMRPLGPLVAGLDWRF